MFDMNAFGSLLEHEAGPERFFGVTVGVVTNNQDPAGLGRVKVKLPWLSSLDESAWARIVTPMAGRDRGIYFVPEVDDEVLVAFEHGDVRSPYVLGALWNGQDKPPEPGDDKNTRRTIKSRSGHVIRLDDTEGKEKIEILDRTGKNSIVISAADNTVTIRAENDIVIETTGGKVSIKARHGVEITSEAGVTLEAQDSLDLQASGQVNVKGSIVNLN